MKFLFKIAFLTLMCTSNFVFGLATDKINNLLSKKTDELKKANELKKIENDLLNQFKQTEKVGNRIDKILNSGNCNCAKLSLLNDEELKIAQSMLVMQYSTPKSEKRIQKEKEDLTKLFHDYLLDGRHEEEKVEAILEQTIEIMKKTNEDMKCLQKILTTINELRNKNKTE